MEVTKVSKEAVEKAEIALGIRKAEELTVADAAEKTKQEEIKKAEEVKVALEKEYAEVLKKAEELKSKIAGETVIAPVIVKAEEKIDATFEKSINEKFTHLATLISAKNEENVELKKAVDELSTKLQKAEEFNSALGRKVGIIEKQPLDRKAVTTQSFIEKGGDGKSEPVTKELSLTSNRKEISDILFTKATETVDGKEKVVHPTFAKASQYVELGVLRDDANLTKSVQEFFKKEHNIVLTK